MKVTLNVIAHAKRSHGTPLIACISFSPSSHFFFFFQLFLIKVRMRHNIVMLSKYSKMNQPYIYMYIHIYIPPLPGHCRALSRVPCAGQYVLVSHLLYTESQECTYVSPGSEFLRPPPFPIGAQTFVLYHCVSIAALHIRSSIPFV